MGYKYEVLMWVMDRDANCYNDIQFYTGDSFIKAILAARRAKLISACVTFKWR